MTAAIGALAIAAFLAGDPTTESSRSDVDAQALGKVEVRERQSGTSDGRSTAEQDAAPGLSTTAQSPPAPLLTPTLPPPPRPTPARPTPTEVPDSPTAIPAVPDEPTPDETDVPALVVQDAPPVPEPAVDAADGTLATRGAEALDLISYPWRTRLAGWQLEFLPGRDGVRGLTYTGERRIEIFVRGGDTAWDIARVAAHELGHAVDLRRNSSSDRELWRDQRGLGDVPWWPESGAPDFATGAGDFAECWATWQVGSASLSQIGGACTAEDLSLIAELS